MDDTSISKWECSNTSLHADCKVYKILKERWRNDREASESDFYVMDVADWAVTIAITPEGKIVLVRQFRFGTGDFSWELPAGVVDADESALDAGVRELYEESGYRGDPAIVLGVVHPNPAIQRNLCHLILVRNAMKIDGGAPGPHEFFDVREIAPDRLFEWARSGRITHAIVHAALFYLRDYLDQ
jgi:8-oxo-dGTP pyrophosphatase MutT (NUDIX family)